MAPVKNFRQVFPKRYTGRSSARSGVLHTTLVRVCGRMDLQLEAVPGFEPGYNGLRRHRHSRSATPPETVGPRFSDGSRAFSF